MVTLSDYRLTASGRSEAYEIGSIVVVSLGLLFAAMVLAVLFFAEPIGPAPTGLPLHHGVKALPADPAADREPTRVVQ